MNVPETEDVIEVAAFWTWMGDDGVARTKVKPDINLDIELAKENTAAVHSLVNKVNKDFALVVDARDVKSISKEARDHFSMVDRDSPVLGFAILIGSPLSRVIANFFMGLNKPVVPAKVFTDEAKALAWLRQVEEKVG